MGRRKKPSKKHKTIRRNTRNLLDFEEIVEFVEPFFDESHQDDLDDIVMTFIQAFKNEPFVYKSFRLIIVHPFWARFFKIRHHMDFDEIVAEITPRFPEEYRPYLDELTCSLIMALRINNLVWRSFKFEVKEADFDDEY